MRNATRSRSYGNALDFAIPILTLAILFFPLSTGAVSATGAVYECWKWASYDICVVQSTDGICPSRFQQYAYSNPEKARSHFSYYLDKYADKANFTAESRLRRIFSPSDNTYATSLDATYNTTCATDPQIVDLLTTNTTEGSAEDARQDYLLLLQQASFCGPNQIAMPFVGCVCIKGKDCTLFGAAGEKGSLNALFGAVLFLVVAWLWGTVLMLRSARAIQSGWSAQNDAYMAEIRKNEKAATAAASARQQAPAAFSLVSPNGTAVQRQRTGPSSPPVKPKTLYEQASSTSTMSESYSRPVRKYTETGGSAAVAATTASTSAPTSPILSGSFGTQ